MAEATVAMAAEGEGGRARQQDRAFEIFVKRAINSIHKESWGRTKESKDLKDSCQQFLTLLEQHETGAAVYEGNLAHAVLQTLMLACTSSNIKIVQVALGAMHKLVAYAWLQGESSTSEDLIADDSDIVTRLIKQVIRCVEISNPDVQLAVIQALLTFTTAEHFTAHGDSLMSAVRAVFNLALGSESEAVKRVACNALLQILNTVTKRVTAYYHALSIASSRRESEHEGSAFFSQNSEHSLQHRHSVGSTAGTPAQAPGQTLPPRPSAGVASQLTPQNRSAGTSADGAPDSAQPVSDARTAQLAQLAEQHDIRGLEAAIGAGTLDEDGKSGAGLPETPRTPAAGDATTPTASAARQDTSAPGFGGAAAGKGKATEEPVVRLSVAERDVLLVLTAFCKLASREAGLTEVESYLHQGKLLALELLVKVLQNPQHRWENVRDVFTRHMRQPLCTTLLRNWATTDPSSFQLAIKLLLAIMLQPKLRGGLKAELGAFYPLFVLLPLEHGCGNAGTPGTSAGGAGGSSVGPSKPLLEQTDLHTLYIVLSNLKQLCADPQMLVDIFVNYDCDAQAPPLFERTMRVLGLIAQRTDISDKDRMAIANQPASKQQAEALARLAAVRDAAHQCISAALQSINQWAGPLREQQLQHLAYQSEPTNGHSHTDTMTEVSSEVGSTSGSTGGVVPGGDGGAGVAGSEAERLEAVWAHKSSLAKGIALFNTSPTKGVKYLVSQGLVEKTPQAVATFFRSHVKDIDKTALGEYLGHHDSFPIAVMHAFIDQERYQGITIDVALRRLLCQFRLPGEAQKIDRIMEKFAERFYLDNPGQFRNADGPYLLSFAIVMLNTDAHNPLAERRLGKPEFVSMCHQTLSEEEGGGMAPVLDPPLLEAIYERIVAEEIVMTDPETRPQSKTQSQQANGTGARGPGSGTRQRLASALGLHVLAAPFKPFTRSWGKAAQGLGDADRKRELLQLAERAITRGSGGVWVEAVHCELCRPMLTVGAAAVMDALQAGVTAAPVPAAAEPLLAELVMIAQLGALLRLDDVRDRAVAVLAEACNLSSPGPMGSAQEAKQLSALKKLLSLASPITSGSLGSAWVVILRTVSVLNNLTNNLLQPVDQPAPAAAPSTASSVASPFNRMFQAWGISLGGAAPAAPQRPMAAIAQRTTSTGLQVASNGGEGGEEADTQLHFIRQEPGGNIVSWAVNDGKAAVDQVFSVSSSLDGEAVCLYFSALCAISSEELNQPKPRMTFLQKLVQCSYANADRIRLIWAKLWAVISAHLVAASCHSSRPVALYSVDALRGLSTRLLSRAELAHFRAQEEALAPFVAVLRQSDDSEVRDATVFQLTQAITAQPLKLGSGWKTLLEALTWAGADSNPNVVAHAAQALALPVRALYSAPPPAGHAYFSECVKAAVVAAQNSQAAQDVSVAAVQVLQGCATQYAHLGLGSGPVGASRTTSGTAPEGDSQTGLARAPSTQLLTSMTSTDLSHRVDGWTLLLTSLADIIQQQDSRPQVANTASQAVMVIMQDHSSMWTEGAWQTLLARIVPALFHPSAQEQHPADDTAHQDAQGGPKSAKHHPRHQQQHTPSPEFVSRAQQFFPLMCGLAHNSQLTHQQEILAQLAQTALQWLQQSYEPLMKCGLSGYEHLLRQAVTSSDVGSLQRLVGMLQPVLQSQLISAMAATRALHARGHSAGKHWPAALASSSHMLLLVHRVLARLHTDHWQRLPWSMQVLLLEPLATCTRQCMLFNQTLEVEAAAQHHHQQQHATHSHTADAASHQVEAPTTPRAQGSVAMQQEQQPVDAEPATQEPAQGAGRSGSGNVVVMPGAQQGSDPSRQPSVQDQDEAAADHILETGTQTAAGVRPSSDPNSFFLVVNPIGKAPEAGSAHSESDAQQAAQGGQAAGDTSKHHSHGHHKEGRRQHHHADSSSPHTMLMRLEMEAARGVIDSLEICIQGTPGSGEGDDGSKGADRQGDVQEALSMLHGLCSDIIKQGAASLTRGLQLRQGSELASVLSDHKAQDQDPVMFVPAWLSDVQAPLLARAVLVMATTPGAQQLSFVRSLFPHLLVVMCSHQAMVREAVAVYFSHAVRPLVMS